MEKGIHLYNHGAYREAKNCFNKAIFIDTEDFESNFWLLRTLTMLHEYDAAETLAVRCAKLEPRVASQLVVSWQEVIKIRNQDLNAEIFNKLNSETDRLLEYFQHNRSFSIEYLAFFVLSVFFFALVMSSVVKNGLSIFLFIIFLYYRKPLLIPNLWIAGNREKRKIAELFFNTNFVKLLISYVLVLAGIPIFQLIVVGKVQQDGLLMTDNIVSEILLVATIGPVAEEIVFRGMLFKFVIKYANAWAYPIVSIMFYFYHGSFATLQHFVMSMVFCWAYARYETLWAPILLHMLQNIPHVVAVIWEHVNNII